VTHTTNPLDLALIGVPKSGTTSLFTWLAAHPEVQGSAPKETFYFIDFDGEKAEQPTFDDEGWEGFERFFSGPRHGRLRLEASPSNVFSDMALRAITSLQPAPLVIAALRCPAQQIRSGFYFSQNNGAIGQFIDPDLTFPEYVDALLNENPEPLARAVSNDRLRWYLTEALRRNKYVDWLDRWSARLPSEAMMVIGFEELTEHPRETLEHVCKRAGIDGAFFADYEFEAVNRTLAQRNGRVHRFAMAVNRAVPQGRLHDVLAKSYRRIRFGQYLGSAVGDEEAAAMRALGEYFAPANQALAYTYGVDISRWWGRAPSP